jgi:hypothetical protein
MDRLKRALYQMASGLAFGAMMAGALVAIGNGPPSRWVPPILLVSLGRGVFAFFMNFETGKRASPSNGVATINVEPQGFAGHGF